MNNGKSAIVLLYLEEEVEEDGAKLNITHQETKRLLRPISHQVKSFFPPDVA